ANGRGGVVLRVPPVEPPSEVLAVRAGLERRRRAPAPRRERLREVRERDFAGVATAADGELEVALVLPRVVGETLEERLGVDDRHAALTPRCSGGSLPDPRRSASRWA